MGQVIGAIFSISFVYTPSGFFLLPAIGLVFGLIGCTYPKEMIGRATAFLGATYISFGFIFLFFNSVNDEDLFVFVPILFIVFSAGLTFAGYMT